MQPIQFRLCVVVDAETVEGLCKRPDVSDLAHEKSPIAGSASLGTLCNEAKKLPR